MPQCNVSSLTVDQRLEGGRLHLACDDRFGFQRQTIILVYGEDIQRAGLLQQLDGATATIGVTKVLTQGGRDGLTKGGVAQVLQVMCAVGRPSKYVVVIFVLEEMDECAQSPGPNTKVDESDTGAPSVEVTQAGGLLHGT